MDDISKRGGTAVPALQGQSLYNIYNTYSFTANVSMMGCMSIQPTQYFDLYHIPIFNGVHMITETNHTINADSIMETTFKGVRVGKYVQPIVTEFATSVRALLDGIRIETAGTAIIDENQKRSPNRLVRKLDFEYRKNASSPLFDDDSENIQDYSLNRGVSVDLATGIKLAYTYSPDGISRVPDGVLVGGGSGEFK